MSVVIRRALVPTAIANVLGTSAAWHLTRALATAIEGMRPPDPAIFVGSAGLFALVAIAAAAIPAYRTTRINPVVALTAT